MARCAIPMNKELNRLSTFAKIRAHRSKCVLTLARIGFYYHADIDKIVCHGCNLSLNYRQENVDTVEMHRIHAPRCRLFQRLESGNIAMTPLMSCEVDGVQATTSRFGEIGIVYVEAFRRAKGRGVFQEISDDVAQVTVRTSVDLNQQPTSDGIHNDPLATQFQEVHNSDMMIRNSETNYDLRLIDPNEVFFNNILLLN